MSRNVWAAGLLAAVAVAGCTGRYTGGTAKTVCEVRIYSMPHGARLFLNGHYVGRTPYKFTAVNDGDSSAHFVARGLSEIVARKQGYDDEVEVITVANCYRKLNIEQVGVTDQVKGYRGQITLYLDQKERAVERKHGNILIAAVPEEPDAEIYLNDNLIGNGRTSLLKLPEGNYILKVRKPGFAPYTKVVGVLADNDLTVTAILEPVPEDAPIEDLTPPEPHIELSPAGREAEIEHDSFPGTIGGLD
ncbi:MAG: PEGA domain-containing protein [bacterium]|nr:PEGA domain-containing protein [bacterium]